MTTFSKVLFNFPVVCFHHKIDRAGFKLGLLSVVYLAFVGVLDITSWLMCTHDSCHVPWGSLQYLYKTALQNSVALSRSSKIPAVLCERKVEELLCEMKNTFCFLFLYLPPEVRPLPRLEPTFAKSVPVIFLPIFAFTPDYHLLNKSLFLERKTFVSSFKTFVSSFSICRLRFALYLVLNRLLPPLLKEQKSRLFFANVPNKQIACWQLILF